MMISISPAKKQKISNEIARSVSFRAASKSTKKTSTARDEKELNRIFARSFRVATSR